MADSFASIVPKAPTTPFKLKANHLKRKLVHDNVRRIGSRGMPLPMHVDLLSTTISPTTKVCGLVSPRVMVVDSSSEAILRAHGLDRKQPFRSPMVRQQILDAEKRLTSTLTSQVATPSAITSPFNNTNASANGNSSRPVETTLHSAMSVQEALEVLQRLISQFDFTWTLTSADFHQLASGNDTPTAQVKDQRNENATKKDLNGRIARFLLETLRQACWQQEGSDHMNGILPPLPLVAFEELHRGLNEMILEKTRRIKVARDDLHNTIAQNDTLPQQICEIENEITTTIDAFTSTAAEELALLTRNEQQVARQVTKEIQKLRKRKELRAWACNELRNALNDQMTRASELKKQISVVMNDVKREDTTYRVKAKRLEEMMAALTTTTGPAATTSGDGAPIASFAVTVGGSGGAGATAGSGGSPVDLRRGATMAGVTPSGLQKIRERLAMTRQRQASLQEEILKRKVRIKSKTEQIFEIRQQKQQLEAQSIQLQQDVDQLNDQDNHLRRSCTPRPNWEELGRDLHGASDERASKTKLRGPLSRHSDDASSMEPASGSSPKTPRYPEIPEVDEDESRVLEIISSQWSTIEKVQSLERELTAARERSQSGEKLQVLASRIARELIDDADNGGADQAVAMEQIKLKHLQEEIARTLSKLHSLKSKNH